MSTEITGWFCAMAVATAALMKPNWASPKKKELVGDFKNAGRKSRPQGAPEDVRVHDFLIKELGRAVPYGIYDLAADTGWVNVGVDNDTAAFAAQTIRRWWQEVGRVRYPLARRLLITADGGGSNGSRVRLWKLELQRLADELDISIKVHHLPPGEAETVRDVLSAFAKAGHPGESVPTQPIAPSSTAVGAATEAHTLLDVLEWHAAARPDRVHVTVLEDKIDRHRIVDLWSVGARITPDRCRLG